MQKPPAKESDIITFGSFNNRSKITPEVVRVWSNILTSITKAQLVLKHKSLSDPTTKRILFKKFNQILNKNGILIVGYPIENRIIKLVRYIEPLFFRRNVSKKMIYGSYKKTKEFTGHISDWKKIDKSMKKYFRINKKIHLNFCLVKYYAIRKSYKE